MSKQDTSIPDEIEMKFYPVDISEMRNRLRALGATCVRGMRLMRRATFSQTQNPHLDIAYIRVRDEGHQITLSLKDYPNKANGRSYQRERMVVVNDFASTRQILKATGLVESAYQETKREEWLLNGSIVSIDIWPGLKPYIEVESPTESGLRDVVKSLGMQFRKGNRQGAISLYMQEYNIDLATAYSLFHGGVFAHLTFRRYPEGIRLKGV